MAVSIGPGYVEVLESGCVALGESPPSVPAPLALNQANKNSSITGSWEDYETSYYNSSGTALGKPLELIKASLLLPLLLSCLSTGGETEARSRRVSQRGLGLFSPSVPSPHLAPSPSQCDASVAQLDIRLMQLSCHRQVLAQHGAPGWPVND